MTVNTEKNNGTCRIGIEGEMTIFNALNLKKDLMDALTDCSATELDLSQVSEFDTSGLQLMILAKRESENSNKSFRIISYSPAVMAVMELFNMKEYF